MQPVFEENTDEIVFWVAARGHHTDIGGLEGSCMHPDTTHRSQEGAVFKSTFLVRDGVFNEEEVRQVLAACGEFPNCLPSRRFEDNISDLKAQCASCAVGSAQIHDLFREYGKEVVQFYMKGETVRSKTAAADGPAIRDNAELGVRNFLKGYAGQVLRAEERMGE